MIQALELDPPEEPVPAVCAAAGAEEIDCEVMTDPSDCVVVIIIVDTPPAEDGSEVTGVEELALESDGTEVTMDVAEVALVAGCEDIGGFEDGIDTAVDGSWLGVLPGLLGPLVFGGVFGALVGLC